MESFRVQQWSLSGKTQVGLLGSTSQCWVSWMFTLDFLYPYQRIHKSSEGRPPSAVLCWPGEIGNAARGKPSNVVLLWLWVSASPLGFRIFTMVFCLYLVPSWSSNEELWSQKWPLSLSWWHHSVNGLYSQGSPRTSPATHCQNEVDILPYLLPKN